MTGYRPRLLERRVRETLGRFPVVLVQGPRQSGKTTLVRRIAALLGREYFTLDDEVVRAAASADPIGFVEALPGSCVIEEIQRVPDLFLPIERRVDGDRRPGSFLLTGSTSVLLVPGLSESLAGRMAMLRLHPFAQCELEGRRAAFLAALRSGRLPLRRMPRLGPQLATRITTGGYPPAVPISDPNLRAAWYRDYVEAILQRDVREFSQVRHLDVMPRLLEVAASQTARTFNLTRLAGPFRLTAPTIASYIAMLERVFLIERVPAWHATRLRRATKAPKLHVADTGLACALLGAGDDVLLRERELLGQLFETFVLQELRRQAGGLDEETRFFHYRDRDGREVDIVLEFAGRWVAGVEVKAGATVRERDFHGLRQLARVAGERFVCGAVVHDGETCIGFGDRMFAVPARMLWELGDRAG
ncbi:MAG: ATP-binding protein [Acidobacteriota bacterium]